MVDRARAYLAGYVPWCYATLPPTLRYWAAHLIDRCDRRTGSGFTMRPRRSRPHRDRRAA